MKNHQLRQQLRAAKRVVVKIGSRVLVQQTGRPDTRRIRALVQDLMALYKDGREVVVVSSGAIGAGVQALGLKTRPTDLPDLQMAAAVGQTRLMTTYDKLFAAYKCKVGQVLLTHADLKDRQRHLNARNTMMNLLRHGIVPIVNENDVVSVDEIKFGDNDMLASRVAMLLQADLLVLLTTVDGFYAPDAKGRSRRVPLLPSLTDEALSHAKGKGSTLSTGGMASKLRSAYEASSTGVMVVIANGRKDGALLRVVQGEDEGTLLPAAAGTEGNLSSRKQWIAFFHRAQGTLVVDPGARDAIVLKGKSLLPIGIKSVEGHFDAGAVVNVSTQAGALIARGLASYASEAIRAIQGRRTGEIAQILGACDYPEVIHRDNMVVLPGNT